METIKGKGVLITMLVKDETKYCWCEDEVAGEPQIALKRLLRIM